MGARSRKPALPGNHGQFGENVATEDYRRLRATQRVTVKPVVPRTKSGMVAGPGPRPARSRSVPS